MEVLYELTIPQKSIWLMGQFYGDNSLLNISASMVILKQVDFVKLEKAIQIFIKRNNAIRMRITLDGETPKQFVGKYKKEDIDVIEFQDIEELKKESRKLFTTPIKLLAEKLFKVTILKFKNGYGGLNVNLSHIISDAWGSSIIANQILDTYQKLLDGYYIYEDEGSYLEYINVNSEYEKSEKFIKDKEYWEETFSEIPELAAIKRYDGKSDSTEASRKEFKLSEKFCRLLNEFCKKNKTTPYTVIMAVFSIYLSRVSKEKEVVIGTPFLNRTNIKEKNIFGMFTNTLPNKFKVDGDLSFKEFVSLIGIEQMAVFRHSRYAGDRLLEYARKQSAQIKRLYDIVISYQNAKKSCGEGVLPNITDWVFNGNIPESFNVHIHDFESSNQLKILYDYQICKFTEEEVSQIHDRIMHIFEQVLKNEEIAVKEIEIVTLSEKQKLVYEYNNTDFKYEKNKTMETLFEEQVQKTPNNIAVVCGNKKITYKELNEKANSVAHFLESQGVMNKVVAIMCSRSIELYVGILGIIKAGGIYLPIDPGFPEERIEYMLENSEARMLLYNGNNSEPRNILQMNVNELTENGQIENLEHMNKPGDVLYLIYTSRFYWASKGSNDNS